MEMISISDPSIPEEFRPALERIRQAFQEAFDATETYWQHFATYMPSPAGARAENTYAWMDCIPNLREWTGKRTDSQDSFPAYAVKNEKAEDTISLPFGAVVSGDLDGVLLHVKMIGRATKIYPDQMVSRVLKSDAPCLDGLPLFHREHSISYTRDHGHYSNMVDGVDLNVATAQRIMDEMSAYRGSDDAPLGVNATMLIAPVQLHKQAKEVAAAVGVHAVTSPYLMDPGEWYMASDNLGTKPIVFQGDAPQLLVDQSNWKLHVGVRTNSGAGPGLPFLIYRAHK